MHTVRIAHCPMHGPSWTQRVGGEVVRLNADSAGLTECYHAVPWMRRRAKYRCFTGTSKRVDARGRRVAWDVAILVKRQHKIITWGAVKVADEIPGDRLKYHPERWLVWVIYQPRIRKGVRLVAVGKPIAHFALHTPLGAQNSPKIAKQVLAVMSKYEAEAKAAEREYGALVVTTGDLQLGAGAKHLWMPEVTFSRMGLSYLNHRIDWLAHSKGLRPHGALRVIPTAQIGPGEDHEWMVQDFREAA